jgi:hypothetical protein
MAPSCWRVAADSRSVKYVSVADDRHWLVLFNKAYQGFVGY